MASYRKIVFVVASLILILVQSSYGQGDTVNLQLRWKHQFQFAGYYAAQKKGFYENENLKVKIQEYTPGHSSVDIVLSGEAQYGVFGSDVLLSYMQGKPVKVLACIFQHSPYSILSLEGRGVSKPTDLSGKKIMAAEMGSIILKSLLQNEGIPQDSIAVVPLNIDRFFKDSTIAALIVYKAFEPFKYEKEGYKPIQIDPSDYGVDFYGDVLFTSESETRDYPERTEKFKRASLRGWEYALEHPDEIIDYILKLPGVKERGIDRQMLRKEFLVMEKLIRPNLVEIGHMNKGRWEFILKRFSQLGITTVHKSTEDLLYFPENKVFMYAKVSVYLIGLLLVVALFFFIRSVFIKHNLVREQQKVMEMDTKSRFNEESLRLILNNAGILLWDWNRLSNSFSFLGYNDNIDSYTSIYQFKNALHTEDQDKLDMFVDLLPENFREEIRIKIGETFQWKLLTIKARKFDDENSPLIYTGMLIDISEIKQKEEHLDELSKELETTNSELEKFAYITSHNIRAPIVNLESLIDFYDVDCIDKEANNDIVNKIHISVQRLKDTLEDLILVTSRK